MSNAFSVLVSARSWDWLRELCRPLGVQAQLVDAGSTPLLPREGPSGNPSLRDLLASRAGPLAAAIRTTLQAKTQQSASAEGVDVVCAPLAVEGRTQGVLVIARLAKQLPAEPLSGQQLGTITGWLAGAVEQHLSSAAGTPDNLSALHKVL